MGFVITRGQGDLAGAIYCVNSSPTIAHCLIVGNRATGARGAAIYCANSEAAFINCTIADNVGGAQGGGVLARDSNLIVTNSILWGNLPCEMLLEGLSEPWITYTDMAGGWVGVGNLETDPLFAQRGFWAVAGDPNTAIGADDSRAVWVGGDYHVQSEAGRWDPQAQTWVQDEMSTPCLDAGDPASPVGPEPIPHGGLINLGVYGGTVHAGKSDLAP
jgi:hypothetical protein